MLTCSGVCRFLLNGSSEVGSLLVKLAEASGMEPVAHPFHASSRPAAQKHKP